MLNIRFVANDGRGQVEYIGLPTKETRSCLDVEGKPIFDENDVLQTYRVLVAPSEQQFIDWWKDVQRTYDAVNKIIRPDTREEVLSVEIVEGGYYNENPHTNEVLGTIVCHPTVLDSYPLPKGVAAHPALRWDAPPPTPVPTGVDSDLPPDEGQAEEDPVPVDTQAPAPAGSQAANNLSQD
jgi:hypothetical protein